MECASTSDSQLASGIFCLPRTSMFETSTLFLYFFAIFVSAFCPFEMAYSRCFMLVVFTESRMPSHFQFRFGFSRLRLPFFEIYWAKIVRGARAWPSSQYLMSLKEQTEAKRTAAEEELNSIESQIRQETKAIQSLESDNKRLKAKVGSMSAAAVDEQDKIDNIKNAPA